MQKDLIEEIGRLNIKLMKISNYNDLEIEEYEKEIERLNNEHYFIHQTWLELKHQYEILKLEILGLHQILEKNYIKIIK